MGEAVRFTPPSTILRVRFRENVVMDLMGVELENVVDVGFIWGSLVGR